jgi:exopolysaccharide production protein ExoQ
VSGLNDSKNEQADIVGNGFLITVLVFCVGLSGRRALQCGLALITGVAQVYATLAARSAGAVGGLIFALGVFALLLTFRKAGGRGRRVIVGIASVGAVVMAMTFLWFTDDVLTWLSVAFGKDVTLTGRTYLWERASELLLEHPLVGQGFGAFWQQGNLDAEGLWRFAHITDRTGFNFHNTAYDVLIELGWCGLLLFLVSVVKGFASVAAGYVRRPSMLNCYWLSVGAFLLVRMPIETIGIYEFYFSTVLLFAIFGSAAAEPRIIRLRAPLAGQPR